MRKGKEFVQPSTVHFVFVNYQRPEEEINERIDPGEMCTEEKVGDERDLLLKHLCKEGLWKERSQSFNDNLSGRMNAGNGLRERRVAIFERVHK